MRRSKAGTMSVERRTCRAVRLESWEGRWAKGSQLCGARGSRPRAFATVARGFTRRAFGGNQSAKRFPQELCAAVIDARCASRGYLDPPMPVRAPGIIAPGERPSRLCLPHEPSCREPGDGLRPSRPCGNTRPRPLLTLRQRFRHAAVAAAALMFWAVASIGRIDRTTYCHRETA